MGMPETTAEVFVPVVWSKMSFGDAWVVPTPEPILVYPTASTPLKGHRRGR